MHRLHVLSAQSHLSLKYPFGAPLHSPSLSLNQPENAFQVLTLVPRSTRCPPGELCGDAPKIAPRLLLASPV